MWHGVHLSEILLLSSLTIREEREIGRDIFTIREERETEIVLQSERRREREREFYSQRGERVFYNQRVGERDRGSFTIREKEREKECVCFNVK